MAQNQFKTRYVPNFNGTESTTALTNSNCAFVNTYTGDDNTGDGTRQKPYRSMTKALLKGTTYIIFRGVINEAFIIGGGAYIYGDDINQVVVTSNYTITLITNGFKRLSRCTISGNVTTVSSSNSDTSLAGVIVTSGNVSVSYNSSQASYFCILKSITCAYGATSNSFPLYSIADNTYLSPYVQNRGVTYWSFRDNILFGLDTNNPTVYAGEIIQYCVIIANSPLRLNGINAIIPAYTNDPIANVALFKNAMLCAGYSQSWIDGHMPLDSFGNETNRVVKEYRAGGLANVFTSYYEDSTGILSSAITAGTAKTSITLTVSDSSKWPTTGWIFMPTSSDYTANSITMPAGSLECFTYTSVTINSSTSITLNGSSYTFKAAHAISSSCTRYGDLKGYSLNPDNSNVALFSSSSGGYCGARLQAYDSIQLNMTPVVVVDESTGADTATSGDLIELNSVGDFVFNSLSTQTWNRFRDSVTKYIPQGSAFKGGGGDSTDGSPFGYYIGKKQNLIGTTKYYAGDTLTVGKWYKVFNDNAISVSNAIVYNSVQYLQEYTFCCITGVTTFSLLNAGTGTYVMEIIADVLESIEIIPYDDMTTESAFPKFS